MKNLRVCIMLFAVLTALTGVIYPAALTWIAAVAFPHKAAGSLIKKDGVTIGSLLIGQKFGSPVYFWGRPSVSDYSALPSAASNLGPTSMTLRQEIDLRSQSLSPYFSGRVPPELVYASASGLDPHISPQAALAQIDHVAKARNLSEEQRRRLAELVRGKIQGPQWSVFGQARVNVLELNLALDELFPITRAQGARQ